VCQTRAGADLPVTTGTPNLSPAARDLSRTEISGVWAYTPRKRCLSVRGARPSAATKTRPKTETIFVSQRLFLWTLTTSCGGWANQGAGSAGCSTARGDSATTTDSQGGYGGQQNAAKGENSSDIITAVLAKRGTDADYLTARIARDRPDILDRMKSGDYPSVRAAAKEAGLVKSRISISMEPDKAARTIRRHFDATGIAA